MDKIKIVAPIQRQPVSLAHSSEAKGVSQAHTPEPTGDWLDSDPNAAPRPKDEARPGIAKNWEIQKEGISSLDHPLFAIARDVYSLGRQDANSEMPIIEEIINTAVNTLQTDNPDLIFNYLSAQLRRTNGKSLRAILQRLEIMKQEIGGGE